MSQSPHFLIFAAAYALSGSLFARQLPHRGSQGRLRRRTCTNLLSALGGRCPPGATKFLLVNLVVQPALSVTAFSRASSPRGRAKGRLRRPALRNFCSVDLTAAPTDSNIMAMQKFTPLLPGLGANGGSSRAYGTWGRRCRWGSGHTGSLPGR